MKRYLSETDKYKRASPVASEIVNIMSSFGTEKFNKEY